MVTWGGGQRAPPPATQVLFLHPPPRPTRVRVTLCPAPPPPARPGVARGCPHLPGVALGWGCGCDTAAPLLPFPGDFPQNEGSDPHPVPNSLPPFSPISWRFINFLIFGEGVEGFIPFLFLFLFFSPFFLPFSFGCSCGLADPPPHPPPRRGLMLPSPPQNGVESP